MKFKVIDRNNVKILRTEENGFFLDGEEAALDLIGNAGANGTTKILILPENLCHEFFDLKTRIAGGILQKFANYSITAAFVISIDNKTGRFGELVNETDDYSTQFRFFYDEKEAINWLVTG